MTKDTLSFQRPTCTCNDAYKQRGREVGFHSDVQDENSEAWLRLLDLIAEATERNVEQFEPRSLMPPEEWHSIVTLPPQIATLTSVRKLCLYGSSLVRIPPEIGEMSSLEELDLYTSYRLHWLPYEITRCPNLRDSCISTRALYGNYKNRNPFPKLKTSTQFLDSIHPPVCSICNSDFSDSWTTRWLSLKVATDVVPLLVFACSGRCIDSLPEGAHDHVKKPHCGGRSIEQPPRR